ncbi:MAG: formate dehydrogenase accessory sulfurtransferase FdhD [Anaerolineales bacterium]|nr:formate dehydrogenase accessory sulfurtransferase FdhD [Anaerolineales bacterium]
MKSEESKLIRYKKYQSGFWETIDAGIVIEEPVSLTVNGQVWLTFMCTPSDLDALAVGFLYNEGVINSSDDIASVKTCSNSENIDVWLNFSIEEPKDWRRTSGCTGGLTSVRAQQKTTPILNGDVISPQNIIRMVSDLFDKQQIYRQVGGVHTSILYDGEDSFIMAEDIGRHNTLDKIAGRYILEQVDFGKKILITTGRVSSEMLQKAAKINASIVISRTSPSSLSVDMACQWGITLVGYARRDRFNIYSHPERIVSTNHPSEFCEEILISDTKSRKS